MPDAAINNLHPRTIAEVTEDKGPFCSFLTLELRQYYVKRILVIFYQK